MNKTPSFHNQAIFMLAGFQNCRKLLNTVYNGVDFIIVIKCLLSQLAE